MNPDWEPVFADPAGQLRLKWGLNGESGEIEIWDVSGPGDGFPIHHAHLSERWGREPRHGSDVLGCVTGMESSLTVIAYGDRTVPEALLTLLQARFPHATIVA